MATGSAAAAFNFFNHDTQPTHAARYARAAEHVEVVKALWDSFEDDVYIRDKESGVFFGTAKVHPRTTTALISRSSLDLDGPLPPAPPTEGMKSRQTLIRQIADDNGFTIRQLYQWIASARGHHTVVGSAGQVADRLQEWFESEAADGFNILPP